MSPWARLLSIRGVFFGLRESDLLEDPILQFQNWYRLARRARCPWPSSVALATVSAAGRPSVRMMLLKGVDERGFVFYTHTNGRKAEEMAAVPFAALTFHWIELLRQVRVEGRIEPVSAEESDAYFASRPRGSRIGAWASRQSHPLPDRNELDRRVEEFSRKFQGGTVPRPPHWGGYRLIPERIEFWQGRPSRLHDRFRYELGSGGSWTHQRLYP
ncbi:MAG: pyridoxamine 5'-phosphate oxidase [Kiritimatiellia bacterium]|nr:pyridoxamine 5'-phosphate oxidase [Kiritimatiellia bacterium]